MTCWIKKSWHPSDRCPVTGDLMPGAIPPGLYCEDEATFDRFVASADIQAVRRDYLAPREADRPRAWPPVAPGAIRLRVATPEEAAFFRATSVPHDPVADAQADRDEHDRLKREVNELMALVGGQKPAPSSAEPLQQFGQRWAQTNTTAPPAAPRGNVIPFENRAARRRREARARGRS